MKIAAQHFADTATLTMRELAQLDISGATNDSILNETRIEMARAIARDFANLETLEAAADPMVA